MVQKESQAALEERENELNASPAASAGASLEPPATPAPGEDNPTGAGGAAVSGAAGGARRFLCGVVEGERPPYRLAPGPTGSILVRGGSGAGRGAVEGWYSIGFEI